MPVTGRPLVALKLTLAIPLVWLAGCGLGPPDVGPARAGRPVTLFVEPDAGPDAIVSLVAAARTSVWMEMYLLTDARAIGALVERARAGCDVRVILEPSPYLSEGANQSAFDALATAGARVRWSTPRFTYTHAKALIVDHARLAVLTLNLTGAGLGGNREYAAVDDDAADIAAAEAVFAADETGDLAGAAGRVITSPDASRAALTGLIEQAVESLAIEAEELTDPAIVAALLAARARGSPSRWSGRGRPTRAPPSRSWPRRARRCAPSPTPRPRQGRGCGRALALPRLREPHAHLARPEPRARPAARRRRRRAARRRDRGGRRRPRHLTVAREPAARRYIAPVCQTATQSTAAAARVRLRRPEPRGRGGRRGAGSGTPSNVPSAPPGGPR